MKPRAIAVGGICLTTIYRVDAVPPLPAKAVAHEACRVVDGMAVSAACGFARLGGEARLWGRVGDDPQGASMRAELAAEGIDVSAVRAVPGGRSSHAAGDIFHGALALALAEGRPIDAAARFACTAAALKCTRFGGRLGCPTRQQVEEAGG